MIYTASTALDDASKLMMLPRRLLPHKDAVVAAQGSEAKRQMFEEIMSILQEAAAGSVPPVVWVTGDMVALCRAAAQGLTDYRLDLTDLPWIRAVCLFDDSPIRIDYDHLTPVGHDGKIKDISAAHFGRVDGIVWTSFVRPDGSQGVSTVLLGKNRGLIPGVHFLSVGGWLPFLQLTWDRNGLLADTTDGKVLGYGQFLAALWLMIGQRIAVRQRVIPDRAARRRWGRTRPDEPIPDVVEVTLRKAQGEEHEPVDGGPVEWSHRWIVGGHWRQQWYPKQERHRPKWITPYVKGPDEKPLIVKRQVHAFRR